jgi:hypothetical protein
MERREGNTYNIGKGIVILHMDLVASYPHDFQSCYLFQYGMGFPFSLLIENLYGTLGKDEISILILLNLLALSPREDHSTSSALILNRRRAALTYSLALTPDLLLASHFLLSSDSSEDPFLVKSGLLVKLEAWMNIPVLVESLEPLCTFIHFEICNDTIMLLPLPVALFHY